jgi:enterochelin esterase-like enzyme
MGVLFRFADPQRRLAGVRLQQRIGLPQTEFSWRAPSWELEIGPPKALRMEYLFDLIHADGRVESVPDPNNSEQTGGAFGPKSVLEFPGYKSPEWLDDQAAPGHSEELIVATPALGADVRALIWIPAAPTDRMLLAHDGPEFDRLGALGHYAATHQDQKHYLVLLEPAIGYRDEWYSANPQYAEALIETVLPAVTNHLKRPRSRVVGMGVSLGALAMLHAQRRYPAAFAGLFLQSGSFFLPRTDQSERGYPWFKRVTRFVAEVHRTQGEAVPAALTCGTVEENLANNRRMTGALRKQGYAAPPLIEVPDGHNFIAWRDALHPHLTDLLDRAWENRGQP